MIIWPLFQSVHVPIINYVWSFMVRTYYGIPNLQFESFILIHGLCGPQPCVWFLILFVYGLLLSDLCFGSAVTIVFSYGPYIVIA